MLAILIAGAPAFGQNAVPQVPWDLPDAERVQLEGLRAPILMRIDAYDARVAAFSARCARVTTQELYASCLQENNTLEVQKRAIEANIQQFSAAIDTILNAPCMVHARQLQRDKQAARNQLRGIEQGVRELEQLQKESEEARKAALLLGASTILGPIAEHLESKSRSAAAFKGWLTRYEKQMREKGVPFDALRDRIERTMRGYVSARLQVDAGRALRDAGDVSETWERLVSLGQAIGTGLAQGEATFREFLADPTLRPLILQDTTASDLLRTLVDIAASTKLLSKISPQYAVASFVVDAGYEFKKYESLRGQIMQRYGLTDKMLEGVAALRKQIERTVAQLNACRQTNPGQPLSASSIVGPVAGGNEAPRLSASRNVH